MPRQPQPQPTPSTVDTVDKTDPSPGTNRRAAKPRPSLERDSGAGNNRHTPSSPHSAGKQ